MGQAAGCSMACLGFLVLLLVRTAHGVNIPPANNTVEGIQAAIDGASSGDTVVIPEATIDFGTKRLTLSKAGVSLKGAGSSGLSSQQTIFRSSLGIDNTSQGATACTTSVQDPLLCINGFTVTDGTPPTVIEGIAFINAAQNAPPLTGNYPGPSMGIGVRVAGPSGSTPSVVKDCRFRGFWKNGATGIGILFAGDKHNWRIEGNSFVNTKSPIYYNRMQNLTIVDNHMTKFAGAISVDTSRVVDNLVISHNTINADWDSTTILPALIDVIRGISLSASANAAGDNRNWVITNNLINGVTQGIRVQWSSGATYSLAGVDVSLNSITVTRCGYDTGILSPPCVRAEVINYAPELLNVANNWWGQLTGPQYIVNTSSIVQYDPWIVSFTEETPCQGFCPTDIITGDAVEPVIIGVMLDPPEVSAGEQFTVTVNLQNSVLNARLDVSAILRNTRATRASGITCQPVPQFSGITATTTCFVSATALSGVFPLVATVTTPGNGGQDVDGTASVLVVDGQDCVDPATITPVPSKVTVHGNEHLPVLATVEDVDQAAMPDVSVTFTITSQPTPQPNGYGTTGGSPAQPNTTTQTVNTNSAGQALVVIVPGSEPSTVTVQATATNCSGQLVTSNKAEITVASDNAGNGGQGYQGAPPPSKGAYGGPGTPSGDYAASPPPYGGPGTPGGDNTLSPPPYSPGYQEEEPQQPLEDYSRYGSSHQEEEDRRQPQDNYSGDNVRYIGPWRRRSNGPGGRYPTEERESWDEPSYRHEQRYYRSEGRQPEETASGSYRNGPGPQSDDEQYYAGPGGRSYRPT